MSYKHNNLMAMRQNYWDDESSPTVQEEKIFLRNTLIEEGIRTYALTDSKKY